MELDISRVPYTQWHPHLGGEGVKWSGMVFGKSCWRPASHNVTCFSQGQHSKDVLWWDGFFLEETWSWAVIAQAIFSGDALKLKEPVSPRRAPAQGCYATGPPSWCLSHSFLPDIQRLDLGRSRTRGWGLNGRAAALNLSDQSPGFTCSQLCGVGQIAVSPWASVSPCVKCGFCYYLTQEIIARIKCDSICEALKTGWFWYGVQAHTDHHATGQLKNRWDVRARNSNFIQKASRLRRW